MRAAILGAVLFATSLSHADIWSPDPAKAHWGEDEIYAAYDRWVGALPADALDVAQSQMNQIAAEPPGEMADGDSGGIMTALVESQIWDCSSTAIYLWVRFLYEQRLPMLLPVLFDHEGGPGTVTYSHTFSQYDSIADPERRFLHFVKLLQNLTYVHELDHVLTYPIRLGALQGGVVNLSEKHTRVILGIAGGASTDESPNDAPGYPEAFPLLVTGQWIYTTRWSAPTAFAQLEPFQTEDGELGLRLFRVTVADGDGYRLLKPREHKRYGGREQYRAGQENFRAALFAAHGKQYSDALLLRHGDRIFAEWIAYRNQYIRSHPYPEYPREHASTVNNDDRIVRLYREMQELQRRPEIVAEFGANYLDRKIFRVPLTDFEGWEVEGEMSISFFGETFVRHVARLADPESPLPLRTLRIEDFLAQSVRYRPPRHFEQFVAMLETSGQKINMKKHRSWIRSMSPAVQMELMPYLEL